METFKKLSRSEKCKVIACLLLGKGFTAGCTEDDMVEMVKMLVDTIGSSYGGYDISDRVIIRSKGVKDSTKKYCRKSADEKKAILEALKANCGNINATAIQMQVSKQTVRNIYDANKEEVEQAINYYKQLKEYKKKFYGTKSVVNDEFDSLLGEEKIDVEKSLGSDFNRENYTYSDDNYGEYDEYYYGSSLNYMPPYERVDEEDLF